MPDHSTVQSMIKEALRLKLLKEKNGCDHFRTCSSSITGPDSTEEIITGLSLAACSITGLIAFNTISVVL